MTTEKLVQSIGRNLDVLENRKLAELEKNLPLDARFSRLSDEKGNLLYEIHETFNQRSRAELYAELSRVEYALADVMEQLSKREASARRKSAKAKERKAA